MKLARVLITAAAVCAAAAMPAQAAMAAQAHEAGSSHTGFKLPYKDTNQVGWLTLCGVNLKPVTQGLVTSKPFVWRVVSNVPAPKIYWKKGARAVLYAYQPREQTPAGAWSGVVMATPSLFSSRLHPMAQFTPIDEPLSYMTLDFPPIYDHLIELRLYMGAPGMSEDVMNYAAADIQVIGNTWRLVAGGGSSCTSGKAVSLETITGMPGARGTPGPQTGAAAKEGTSSPSAGSSGSSTGTSGGSGRNGSTDAADVSHASSTGPLAASLGGVAVLIVALLASAAFWRRRRRITG